LCDARGFGVLTPADQLIPEGFKGHIEDSGYTPYDPAKAKELLSQAGYPNGFKTTMYVMSNVDRDIAVAMASMLEAVGIQAALEFPESGAALEMRNVTGWEGLLAFSFTALGNTVDSYYLHYDIYDQFNISAWHPPDLEPAYLEARLTEVVEQSWVEKMQRITLDNMAIIPIYFTSTNYMIRSGFYDTGFGKWSTGTVWMPSDAWRTQ
jgi:peptide/nickel transport system substrate-binding protein